MNTMSSFNKLYSVNLLIIIYLLLIYSIIFYINISFSEYVNILIFGSAIIIWYFIFVRKKEFDLFSPKGVFPIIFFIIYTIGSLDQIPSYRLNNVSTSQWTLYSISLLSYFLAIYVVDSFVNWRNNRSDSDRKDVLSIRYFNKIKQFASFFILTSFLVTLLLYYLLIREYGFDSTFISGETRAQLVLTNQYLNTFKSSFMVLGTVYLSLLLCYFKVMSTGNKSYSLLLLFILIITALLPMYRGNVLKVIMLSGIVFYYFRGKKTSIKKILLIGTIMAAIFIILGYLRINYSEDHPMTEMLRQSGFPDIIIIFTPIIDYIEYPPFVLAEVLELMPKVEGYRYGGQIISPIVNVIDSIMNLGSTAVVEKIDLPHIFLMNLIIGTDESGLIWGFAGGIVSNYYVDGGLIAVIIGMFFIGFMLEYWYLDAKINHSFSRKMIYCILIFNALWSIYGSIFDGIGLLINILLVYITSRSIKLYEKADLTVELETVEDSLRTMK